MYIKVRRISVNIRFRARYKPHHTSTIRYSVLSGLHFSIGKPSGGLRRTASKPLSKVRPIWWVSRLEPASRSSISVFFARSHWTPEFICRQVAAYRGLAVAAAELMSNKPKKT